MPPGAMSSMLRHQVSEEVDRMTLQMQTDMVMAGRRGELVTSVQSAGKIRQRVFLARPPLPQECCQVEMESSLARARKPDGSTRFFSARLGPSPIFSDLILYEKSD